MSPQQPKQILKENILILILLKFGRVSWSRRPSLWLVNPFFISLLDNDKGVLIRCERRIIADLLAGENSVDIYFI